MKEKKENEELQSRRSFFKKAAKSVLPILGAIAFANIPLVSKAAQPAMDCSYGCYSVCSDDCYSQCSGSCKRSCTGSCDKKCANNCFKSCAGSCVGSCSDGCAVACTDGCY